MEFIDTDKVNEQSGLKSLRNLIKNEPGLNYPDDDEFLLRFLRAKDWKVEAAFKALKGYITMRLSFPTNYHPTAVQRALESGMVSVLKHRDLKGRHVFYYKTYLWDARIVTAEEVFIACNLIIEEMLCSLETQVNGIVFIHDLKGMNWRHCFALGLKEMKRMYRVKSGFPARFTQAHGVNPNKAFRILSSIAMSFLPAKMIKRATIYGKDLSQLYISIPRSHLPESLGGELTEDEAIDHQLMDRLMERDSYFKNTSTIICSRN